MAAGAGAAARGLADAANSGDPAWLRRLSDNAKVGCGVVVVVVVVVVVAW